MLNRLFLGCDLKWDGEVGRGSGTGKWDGEVGLGLGDVGLGDVINKQHQNL